MTNNYYSSNPTFYVGIDCIIFGFNEGELNLLLLKRNFQPAMGEWSLMVGFVQQDESVDNAAKRVLAELTGLENVYMEQVGSVDAFCCINSRACFTICGWSKIKGGNSLMFTQ